MPKKTTKKPSTKKGKLQKKAAPVVTDKTLIEGCEKRFKKVSGIEENISTYPLLDPHADTSVETNKDKSKEFGEVFTPLWLVDEMLETTKITHKITTLDLCAGYGQFSIRLMRKLLEEDPKFDVKKFILQTHSFAELQLSSCYKLLNVFGVSINLFIGDAKELGSLPGVAKGIWVYLEKMKGWIPLTKTVKKLISPNGSKKTPASEKDFVTGLQKVIDKLNEGFEKMKNANLNIKWSSETRLHALRRLDEALNEMHPKDESVRTPPSVVADLLESVEREDRRQILVLFNAEIIEALVFGKKVPRENIVFGVDDINEARALFVEKMYGVDTVVFKKEPKNIAEALGDKHWDLVLSNPPYNDKIDLKIMRALVEAKVSEKYVIVHPSSWILDRKGKDSTFNAFKTVVEGKIKSVKLFNGNPIFHIGLWYPCVITNIDENFSGDITVDYFGDVYKTTSIFDDMRYGRYGKTIVSPFFNMIEQFIARYGSVWEKNRKSIDAGKHYAQFSPVRGNHIDNDITRMYKDDFYTVVRQDADKTKAITTSMNNRPGPTFQFDTEVERDNFVDYLKTDFARFCLSLLKISQNIYYGEMSMIPWLDFTQAWDDEKLFAHFDVNKKTQDYIRSFLPDYYGIRKNSDEAAAE